MKPRFATGDLVTWNDLAVPVHGLVVQVAPANVVPDAVWRGLADPGTFGYVYYVLFSDPLKVKGPLISSEIRGVA